MSSINAEDEWSPLRSVIIGRAAHSQFPNEPVKMIKATMPAAYLSYFRPCHPFPTSVLQKADEELDAFSEILVKEGIKVYRPTIVDWAKVGGHTGAMPRDGLLTIGHHIIEAPFAFGCRRHEISLAYGEILKELVKDPTVRVFRAPSPPEPDTLYDGPDNTDGWAINNSRPAFDTADFMRFGKTLLGQLSHVTNNKGVEYLRERLPDGYTLELLEVNNPSAMHIDTTICPLREGLLVYNAAKISEEELRKHGVLKGWQLEPFPFEPQERKEPPLFMTTAWLMMNVLVLDGRKVVIEAGDAEFAKWLRGVGMEPIFCEFKHVHSIGGSFHCATVDLVREAPGKY